MHMLHIKKPLLVKLICQIDAYATHKNFLCTLNNYIMYVVFSLRGEFFLCRVTGGHFVDAVQNNSRLIQSREKMAGFFVTK